MAEEKRPANDRTHAREIPPCPETVGERVAYIADLMGELLWDRKTGPMLAARWGLAESTIKNYSAEASRLVTGDADEARRDITVGAKRLLRKAIEDEDDKAFKNVADVWAMVSGAKAPEKHQVGSLDGASPSKARELMGELFGAVTPSSKPDADPER